MANDEDRVLEDGAKGVVQGSPEGHALRTVPERLRELAPPWYEPGWDFHRWQPPVGPRTFRDRGAGVATFARRLMALERRRMRRSTGGGSLERRPRTSSRVS